VLGWYALAFLCIMAIKMPMIIPTKRKYAWDLEAINDPNGPKDVHEDPTLR